MSISYIYVIGSDEPPYKVGISKNPTRRLKSLQTGCPKKLKILSIKETAALKTKPLESIIHYNLSKYKTVGEWFDTSLDRVIAEVDYALIRYEDDPILHTIVRHKMINTFR